MQFAQLEVGCAELCDRDTQCCNVCPAILIELNSIEEIDGLLVREVETASSSLY